MKIKRVKIVYYLRDRILTHCRRKLFRKESLPSFTTVSPQLSSFYNHSIKKVSQTMGKNIRLRSISITQRLITIKKRAT